MDKMVSKDWKKRNTNLFIAWIDYRKAYDFVPYSWVNKYMALFGIPKNLRTLLQKSMQQ